MALYASVESFAKSIGPMEIVARQRYVLFRSTRIFADFVLMADALRAAVHLGRRVEHPIFFKVGTDRKKVTHVAKLRTLKTNDTPLLLHINMEAGHGGASGRYDYLKEVAFDYAFLLTQLGVEKMS